MTLDLLIPVDNRVDYTRGVLTDVSRNTVIPGNIFIIDNSGDVETAKICAQWSDDLPIVYVKQKENIGVNASWNMALTLSDADYVSIFNNDLALCSFLFEKIIDAFAQNDKMGIVLPKTVGTPESARFAKNSGQNRLDIREGGLCPYSQEIQGYAFTIRRRILVDYPIPSQFVTFFGDLYWFLQIEKLGYLRTILEDAPVHHYTAGVSFKSMHDADVKKLAQSEIALWSEFERANVKRMG
jgi:GT2 family glycosyltransferase